ncbi:hypothetical protein E2P81_ATG00192 [Venturia nashicola]|uniref:Uncharacterized protein n=1 Tax=Venturia nashicola TaxID=86259 RepID=A0A4Z1PEQ5_9PEZI|nr:hypothetical protein E6O75_ATG00200 [Venturia nashicola]TLD39205.1 hypothetical protein E2P81_ATG00192 [Venturia nashicola]
MSNNRPSNFPGHRTNPDLRNPSSTSQALEYGHDTNRGREIPLQGLHRDGHLNHQVPHPLRTGSLDNNRESFMVPHTARTFAEYPGLNPYDWPSMQKDDDTEIPETSGRPMPPHFERYAPRLEPLHHAQHGDRNLDMGQDRAVQLTRSAGSRDQMMATQRKPSLDKQRNDLGPRDKSTRCGYKASRERFIPGGHPGFSQTMTPQARLREREKRGPPVAYTRHAANVDGAATKGMAPLFGLSGQLRESRSAVGVDTFIQSLKDKPLPERRPSHDNYDREQSMAPLLPGRKLSFDSRDNNELRRHRSRKGSQQSERVRNDNEHSLDNSYSLFPPRNDSYGNHYRQEESGVCRSPEDYLQHQSQVSPPMRQPRRNVSFESSDPASRLRPDSHQMFDSQYHRDNERTRHQQGRHNQGHVAAQGTLNVGSSNNNATMEKNKSLHFRRADGPMTQSHQVEPRANVVSGELQQWAGRTIALYRDLELTCCQCNEHSQIFNPGHKEGWDLTPFCCYGGLGDTCYHVPCSNCGFHSRRLRKMAVWPTRRTITENTLAFGSVRWTWLCYRCGRVKRTDQPPGSHPLSWQKKWECDGCGKDWNDTCPTFLIEDRDVEELNRVAESLLRVPPPAPVSRFSPEIKKEKRDLGKRVEGVVHKAGKEFKKLLGKTEVREMVRPSTSKSHSQHHRFGSFGEKFGHFGERESSRKDLRRERTGDPLRKAETVADVPQFHVCN